MPLEAVKVDPSTHALPGQQFNCLLGISSICMVQCGEGRGDKHARPFNGMHAIMLLR